MNKCLKGLATFQRTWCFNSQHPHGDLQSSATLVPGDAMSSSWVLHSHTCRQNIHVHFLKMLNDYRKPIYCILLMFWKSKTTGTIKVLLMDRRGFRQWKVGQNILPQKIKARMSPLLLGDPQLPRLTNYHSTVQERAWKDNRYKLLSPLLIELVVKTKPVTEQKLSPGFPDIDDSSTIPTPLVESSQWTFYLH